MATRTTSGHNADHISPPIDHTLEEEPLERWNQPQINLLRTSAAFWSLFLTGLNDGTYGAMIPYLESYYTLSYIRVSLVFLSPAAGYVVSALLNGVIHERFGQRGIAFLAPACHTIAYIIIALHPPFPALVVLYLLVGLGNGLSDAAWNAWIGAMHDPNQVLGFLHACYGAGATIAPLCATAMVVKAHKQWYEWYFVLLGCAVLEFVSCLYAFWRYDGAAYRAAQATTSSTTTSSPLLKALASKPTARVLWLTSLFLLGYVGVEVALGGWIVTFMLRTRHSSALASSLTATGFWLGITLGRLCLGFVTPRVGEKKSIAIYLPLTLALLLLTLIPSLPLSALCIAGAGFFLGPLFPAAIRVCTALLPRRLHVPGIGFAAAFGGAGGAVLPFAIGALAQAKGVGVLQPVVLVLLAGIWACWLALPRLDRKLE
ncbi:hypothetical protein ANO11243_066310 [Dothideomycetidae sp. 11243]|nr:hypothetical protein ANO11243_066310 [fungal sp. No.11243]